MKWMIRIQVLTKTNFYKQLLDFSYQKYQKQSYQ